MDKENHTTFCLTLPKHLKQKAVDMAKRRYGSHGKVSLLMREMLLRESRIEESKVRKSNKQLEG